VPKASIRIMNDNQHNGKIDALCRSWYYVAA
jgi:hypothetical protein